MHLLVSPENIEEALVCAVAAEYLDVVDVKKPDEGSLGANYPWVIKAVRDATPAHIPVSATLGDVPFKPGTVAQAALGAATAGASYIKVGLYGCTTSAQGIEVMRGVVRTIRENKPEALVVASGYADAHRIGSINPLAIPYIAAESGAQVAMLDTAIKDGSTLFDHLSVEECAEFCRRGHDLGLIVALAGSVKAKHLPDLARMGTDIVGVRGAVCEGGDRNKGTIMPELIKAFRVAIDEAMDARPASAGTGQLDAALRRTV
jgi:hypothetical protein